MRDLVSLITYSFVMIVLVTFVMLSVKLLRRRSNERNDERKAETPRWNEWSSDAEMRRRSNERNAMLRDRRRRTEAVPGEWRSKGIWPGWRPIGRTIRIEDIIGATGVFIIIVVCIVVLVIAAIIYVPVLFLLYFLYEMLEALK